MATGRIVARSLKSCRITVDDGFFYLAVVTLIAGTTVLYFDIPYIYLQEDVEAGLRVPPADFVSQLLHDQRLQDAAAMLLGTTVASVKLSFLFFFKGLLRHQERITMWWWCILVLLLPTTAILIFSNFMVCPYSDQQIFGKPLAYPVFGLNLLIDAHLSSQMCHSRGTGSREWNSQGERSIGHSHRRISYVPPPVQNPLPSTKTVVKIC